MRQSSGTGAGMTDWNTSLSPRTSSPRHHIRPASDAIELAQGQHKGCLQAQRITALPEQNIHIALAHPYIEEDR